MLEMPLLAWLILFESPTDSYRYRSFADSWCSGPLTDNDAAMAGAAAKRAAG